MGNLLRTAHNRSSLKSARFPLICFKLFIKKTDFIDSRAIRKLRVHSACRLEKVYAASSGFCFCASHQKFSTSTEHRRLFCFQKNHFHWNMLIDFVFLYKSCCSLAHRKHKKNQIYQWVKWLRRKDLKLTKLDCLIWCYFNSMTVHETASFHRVWFLASLISFYLFFPVLCRWCCSLASMICRVAEHWKLYKASDFIYLKARLALISHRRIGLHWQDLPLNFLKNSISMVYL